MSILLLNYPQAYASKSPKKSGQEGRTDSRETLAGGEGGPVVPGKAGFLGDAAITAPCLSLGEGTGWVTSQSF